MSQIYFIKVPVHFVSECAQVHICKSLERVRTITIKERSHLKKLIHWQTLQKALSPKLVTKLVWAFDLIFNGLVLLYN